MQRKWRTTTTTAGTTTKKGDDEVTNTERQLVVAAAAAADGNDPHPRVAENGDTEEFETVAVFTCTPSTKCAAVTMTTMMIAAPFVELPFRFYLKRRQIHNGQHRTSKKKRTRTNETPPVDHNHPNDLVKSSRDHYHSKKDRKSNVMKRHHIRSMRKPRDKAVAAEVPATKQWAHSVVEGKPMHESEGCAKGGAGALAGGRRQEWRQERWQ